MRILVTGATGFVGQHLLQLLSQSKHAIFATHLGAPPTRAFARTELLLCDMRNRDQVLQAVRHARPQHVYHLAGLSSVTRSFCTSRDVWETNVWGAMNLLEAV